MNDIKNIDFKDVAKLLRMLRESESLSQEDVAKALNVTKAAVSLWESGECGIKTSSLCDLADFYNISISELISGKLNEESDLDVFKRNYDLSDEPELLKKEQKSIEEYCLFLDKCLSVKKIFFENYLNWMNGETTQFVSDKMSFISKFFRFNRHYGYGLCMELEHETDFIEDLNEDKNIKDRNYYNYRMEQAFSLIINNFSFSAMIEYDNNKLTSKYLAIIPQHIKDLLLTSIVSETINEKTRIEDSFLARALTLNGANCLFLDNLDRIMFSDIANCKELSIDTFKGNANEILINENHRLSTFIDVREEISARELIEKNRFYYNYLKLIDKRTTKWLQNVIRFKQLDPLKYYNCLLSRDQ